MRSILKNVRLPALLFLVAFLQYSNTLKYDFAWDDKLVITNNEYTVKGLEGLPDIFTSRLSVPHKNVYRPVPQSMFAIEYAIFGENPFWFHLFSLVWYGLACLSVYYFVRFVFPSLHPAVAFCSALLFLVHPLHVEVVANIKSRDEILALLFGLISVILLVKGIERNRLEIMAMGIISMTLALLSKENAITLLPVVPLVMWFRSGQINISRGVVISGVVALGIISAYFKLVPILLLSFLIFLYVAKKTKRFQLLFFTVACAAMALFVFITRINNPNESQGLQLDSTVLNNIFLWTTESEKIIPTSIVNIGRYFYLFVFPHPLIHLYGYNQIAMSGWGDISTWIVLILIFYLIFYLFKNFYKKDSAVFGLIFFISTYSVYSNFFVLAPDTMADRYMFLPSIGLILLAMEGLLRLGGFNRKLPDLSVRRSQMVLGLFAMITIGFFIRTWIGNQDWENDYTLIENRIQFMENNAAAQATLGIMTHRKSSQVNDIELQRKLRSDAAKAFTKAIDIYPDFYLAWILIGKIFVEESLYDKAELAFLRAQKISPLSPDAYHCLGALYFVLGDSNRSIDYLEKSILLDPEIKETYVLLGKAYIQNRNIDNLGSLTEAANKWFPNDSDIEAFQAYYLLRNGNLQEAFNFAKTSLAKDPNNILALSILSSPLLSQLPGD